MLIVTMGIQTIAHGQVTVFVSFSCLTAVYSSAHCVYHNALRLPNGIQILSSQTLLQ